MIRLIGENVVEEIESVGQSQVDAVESLLFQAFLHDLKAEAWPVARDVPSWRGDARGFRAQARRKYRPSMRQKIDIAGLYADALQALPDTMDGQLPLPVPPTCPGDARRAADRAVRRLPRGLCFSGRARSNNTGSATSGGWSKFYHSEDERFLLDQASIRIRPLEFLPTP